jgi:anti-sigma-K factor RskA
LNCEGVREDLEAYALGVLEPAQALEVDAHLDECKECSAVVSDYRHAMNHLALAVPLYHASPRLKERIMGGVGTFRPASIPGKLRRSWVLSAAAVVLVGFAIGGTVWAMLLSSEVSRLRQQNAELAVLTQLDEQQRTALLQFERDLNAARNEQERLSTTLEEYSTLIKVALDPDLIPTEMRGVEPFASANCSYVWSTKQSIGALTCKNMPSTAQSLTYELWATKGDETLALGSFAPRFDGSASLLVTIPTWAPGPVTSLWVTLEQASGNRDQPSPQVVLQPVPAQQAQR